MNMLLLTGLLIACYTSTALSNEASVSEFDGCSLNITSIDGGSEVLKNVSSSISYLYLCNNNISTIGRHSLSRFHNLELLRLDNNRHLKFPSDGPFLQLQSLTDLQCFRCGVDRIYNRSLQEIPQLEQINLTENVINQIEVGAFYGNQMLVQIDLRMNQLRRVPNEMLTPLDQLKTIYFSMNAELAPEGSEPFLINTVLEDLWCDECGFVTVQEHTFAKLPGLRKLYLRKNKISHIHGLAFSKVNLIELMLEGNALTTIDSGIMNVISNICLDDNTNELECFLKELSIQKKFICSKSTREDIECSAPSTTTTTTISTTAIDTTSTIDIHYYTTDMVLISDNGRMTNSPETTPKAGELPISISSGPSVEIVEGISNAYIGGYLTLIYLVQFFILFLLVGVWFKVKKYDPDVDIYAENILNPNPIYKAVH